MRHDAAAETVVRHVDADVWPATCAAQSAARSASTPAAARCTPPTPPTTGRCRSAWWCPATRRRRRRGRRGVPAASTRRCCPAAAAPAWPASAATSRSSWTSPSTCTAIVESIPTREPRACSPASCSTTRATQPRAHGLTFGPDPATHSRCTLGGMIGNNSCGMHSRNGPARPSTTSTRWRS